MSLADGWTVDAERCLWDAQVSASDLSHCIPVSRLAQPKELIDINRCQSCVVLPPKLDI